MLCLLGIIVAAGGTKTYVDRTHAQLQPASGGVHIEGVVGSPQFLHPLLAETNSVDQTLVRLIYSGLTKMSPAREVLPDLAESWDILEQGKVYVFHLRPGIKWHDGKPFGADDVMYTIGVLQSTDYNGIYKSQFEGIQVEKIDDMTVKFVLPSVSAFFLSDMSVGIAPSHLYKDIPSSDLETAYNQNLIIGTGPYQLEKIGSDNSITLKHFKQYYGTGYMIDRIVFFFFDSEKNLLEAFHKRSVGAAGLSELVVSDSELAPTDTRYIYRLPQYKAIFFNQLGSNPVLANKSVRQALAYATNKQQIVDEAESGYADIVDSPVLPGFWGHKPDIKKYDFNITKAAEVLKADGWKKGEDGILQKDGARLSLRISIRQDQKSQKIADVVKRNWESVGLEVMIEAHPAGELIKNVIRPRDYEVLIFGQDLGSDSDPYVYWHSSQITDPGLALAVGFDKDLDNNLESARTATSLDKSIAFYHRFQTAFADLVPAVLLYQPRYTYLVDSKVKGVTDQVNLSAAWDRFLTLSQWYIKTKKQ